MSRRLATAARLVGHRRSASVGEPSPVTIVAFGVGPLGGMEIQLTHLIRGLLARGRQVTLIANHCALDPHPLLTWHRVRAPERPFAAKFLTFGLLASWRIARSGRGLVHTLGAIVLTHADVCTVNHCHHAVRATTSLVLSSRGTPAYRLNARLSGWLSRLAERYAYRPSRTRCAVVASGGLGEELVGHFPRMGTRIEVVPNGVDSGRFRPDDQTRRRRRDELGLGEEELLVLFLGGDWERKGLRPAIEAVAMTHTARLLVVGRGHVPEYEAVARRTGAGDRVHFAGTVEDVFPSIVAADVFLLASVYETWSLPTYEAAACGLPLIATRVHGVAEILADGDNGWFVRRDPAEIAGCLTRLRDDPDLRARMGRRSRERAVASDWEQMVEGYSSLYDRLVPSGQRRSAPGPAEHAEKGAVEGLDAR